MELLTLAEAAELTGVNLKALRARADRKTLPTVLGEDGVRRVAASDLTAAGFTIERGTPPQQPPTPEAIGPLAELLAELVAENGRLQRENGALERDVKAQRLLTEQAESGQDHAVNELIEAKATIKALEAQLNGRRWFFQRRRRPAELTA